MRHGVLWRTVNKGDEGLAQRRFVIIGNAGSRRVRDFTATLACLEQPAPSLVTYSDLLAGRVHLRHVVRERDILRLESPGRDWGAECALLFKGADITDDEDAGQRFERLTHHEIEASSFERGRLLASRQWFLGWRAALSLIGDQLAECPPHQVMNLPHEIAEMFDKPRCHRRLLESGIAVPATLGVVRSYEELIERMKASSCNRVFVKLAHGSSASGIVAFRTDGKQRYAAHTTTEVVRTNGQLALYNSRRIRILRTETEIAEVIDALCRHRVHVEEWLPKAGFAGHAFDLRVLVVAGRTRHIVVRMSRSPMTNLHLLNERADADALRVRMPPAAWGAALESCRRAVRLYPGSLTCGVDLMFTPGFRRHAILELNAFGDLLPGMQCGGEDTYQAQVRAVGENGA